MTYVVAQKRHNTRLFVENPGRDGEGKDGCVPAGTVVDSVICHPTEHDFFLQVRSVDYKKSFTHLLFSHDVLPRVPFRLTD